MRTINWNSIGIRPTAVEKKDPPSPRLRRTVWLFLGSETTGQRAAIIHIMVECAKRHGHNAEARLNGVLERLPTMTNQHALTVLLPANWQSGPGAWASVKRSPSCDSRSMFGFGILDSGL
ncbi:MAG: hypothetical protein MUF86_08405 [Akkermansiaceae bacterium]|nr:hypothetical protein [Akkermansiaceae bacterium]